MTTIEADNPNNHYLRCLSSDVGVEIIDKKYITVDGVVVRTARRGLEVRNNSSHITIENSEFKYSASISGYLRDGVDNIIIRDNLFEGGGSIPAHIGGTFAIRDTTYSLIQNNIFTFGAHQGIKMDDSHHNVITHNKVNNDRFLNE